MNTVNSAFKYEAAAANVLLSTQQGTRQKLPSMKIESGRGVAPASSSSTRRAAGAAPGFAPGLDAPARTSAASAASALHSLNSILALQAEGLDPERRRRQVKRGAAALDALEKLERALALGVGPEGLRVEMERLRQSVEHTGEPGLDALMLEIDTRLAVELAKLDAAPQP